MINKYCSILLSSVMFLSFLGCEHLQEPFKTVWGSSTRALDHARIDGITQNYHCRFDECFDAVLSLGREKPTVDIGYTENSQEEIMPNSFSLAPAEKAPAKDNEGYFDVFIKDRVKGVIVVMGIVGNVNSTEVGIFFSRPQSDAIQVDVSSLSDSAKRKVAQIIFETLDKRFPKMESIKGNHP